MHLLNNFFNPGVTFVTPMIQDIYLFMKLKPHMVLLFMISSQETAYVYTLTM
jgi:hypothetical protein